MTKFKEVAHLYKGVPMLTEMGIFHLICYHDGQWMLDTIAYGANAVEQNIKPIIHPLSGMTYEEKINLFGIRNKFSIDEGTFDFDAEFHRLSPSGVRYLLSKHFDLFGLIQSGEAIDSTTIKQ